MTEIDKITEKQLTNDYIDDGLECSIQPHFGGLNWHMKNKKGDTLSIILHAGSYGREQGLFETMCSWKEDVQGFLTFGQVQNKINTLRKKGV